MPGSRPLAGLNANFLIVLPAFRDVWVITKSLYAEIVPEGIVEGTDLIVRSRGYVP